ncbi:MAG: hypothetical protein J6M60_02725 [Clostridia bacterium]|nr:hypothetical protein [Clostridia bacterium]
MRKFNSSNIETSYKYCTFAESISKSLATPLKRFPMLKNYILVIDEETKDVVIIFPSSDINKVDRQLKEIVFTDLTNNFKRYGLNLKEKKGIFKDVYRVGFIPIIFEITCS